MPYEIVDNVWLISKFREQDIVMFGSAVWSVQHYSETVINIMQDLYLHHLVLLNTG